VSAPSSEAQPRIDDLPALDVEARSARVRAFLETQGLDALAVTTLTNVRWLTGFTGSNGAALITDAELVLITDGRYADQAPTELEAAGVGADVLVMTDPVGGILEAAATCTRLGLEADNISWADQRRLAEQAGALELVPTTDALVALRATKDSGELARIRAAAAITDATLASVRPMLAESPTERDIAFALDQGLRLRGATSPAYETIVASGPNGALPHGRPSERRVQEADLIVIDVGAVVDGYRSDMTRTFVVGEPTAAQQRQLDVVLEAQRAGVATVKAGVDAKTVDAACRDVITDAGWADAFTHGTGHGVGLDIHERPRVNSRTSDVLEAGMVVTVEPGVYLPGIGGVRWEDLLSVTDAGAEVLTTSAKQPVVENTAP